MDKRHPSGTPGSSLLQVPDVRFEAPRTPEYATEAAVRLRARGGQTFVSSRKEKEAYA